MKLGEMVNAYGILGEAKMTTLKVEEVMKAVKARKAMRPHVEEWQAYFKDIQEKGKAWESMSDEQRAELNKEVESELGKEVDIEIEKMSEESLVAMIQENGFKMREIDFLGVIVE